MRGRWTLNSAVCATLVAWGGSVISAQEAPALAATAPAETEIAVLLAQLGGDSYAVRERATRNLARFGMAAQPLLAKAAESPDAGKK